MTKKKEQAPKRRSNGEGTVYRIKDGCFGAAISLGKDENGKRIRKVLTGKTEDEVIQKMNLLLKDLQLVKGEEVSVDMRTKTEDFVNTFKLKSLMREVQNEVISSRTYENYEYCLKKFTDYFGNKAIGVIDTSELNRFFSSMIKASLSQAYLDRVAYITERMYKWACKKAYLTSNPFEGDDFIRPRSIQTEQEITALTPDELQEIRTAIKKSPIISPVFELMLASGVRTQEALGLSWKDIDLDSGEIHICRAITIDIKYDYEGKKISRSTHPDTTKTNIKNHKVFLNSSALELIRTWKETAPSISKTKTGDDDFVFGNSQKSHWTYGGFRSSVNTYLTRELENVSSLRLHRIRHTVATILAEDGASLLELMQQLGHTQTKTTMKYIDKASKKIAESNRERLQQGLENRLKMG